MNMEFDILPECYVDTNMVVTLLNIGHIHCKSVNHCKGCNKVARDMTTKLSDKFALGVIDNDKRQHTYTSEFDLLGSTGHIEFLKHHVRPHFLIRITPAMDKFILDIAMEESVDVKAYNLPDRLENFKKLSKDSSAKENDNMRSLFKKLRNNKELQTFRSVLVYLYNHKYTYDITYLSEIISPKLL